MLMVIGTAMYRMLPISCKLAFEPGAKKRESMIGEVTLETRAMTTPKANPVAGFICTKWAPKYPNAPCMPASTTTSAEKLAICCALIDDMKYLLGIRRDSFS